MKTATRAFAFTLASVIAQAIVFARPMHAVRYLMGTWCDLIVFDTYRDDAGVEAAFQEIARLERVLSNWDTDSEISRVNASAGRGARSVSPDLAAVVHEAKNICASTSGAFDPTVGALVHAWRFDSESPEKPSPEQSRDASARVGCDRVVAGLDPPSIALAEGTTVDLGGIGKGYAVDRALAVLRAHGIERAKLDFGSSSLGFVGRTDGGWPVVVADPRDRDQPLLSFRVAEGAVSSSGQRERSFVQNGRRYGHIFDPRAGVPVESDLLLVTVVAPTATAADGLSTGLFVLGAERGAEVVSRMAGVSAIFVRAHGADGVTISTAGKIDALTRLSR